MKRYHASYASQRNSEIRGEAACEEIRASPRYRMYALGALTFVTSFNYLDRSLVSLLLEPIKQDLNLSDTQLGFLTGIAFGVFYAVLGVPMARLADRGNRINLASAAIGLWGLTVMATLCVANIWHFALARIAAAVGEAGTMPSTYSLVGDYYPHAVQRARAMAVYNLASPAGFLVSFVLGAWINEHYGWRLAFFLMGIPGLLTAIFLRVTVYEPRRDRKITAPAQPDLASTVKALLAQTSTKYLGLALILLWTMGYGLAPWYASMLTRSHGMQTTELGLWLGLIFGFGGIFGILAGNFLSERWSQGSESRQMQFCALMIALLAPGLVIFLLAPDRHLALVALTFLVVISNAIAGPTYSLLQRLVPESMRATSFALIMLVGNLIGMGLAPQLIGIASDLLVPALGSASLRFAMLLGTAAAAGSAWFFWKVSRSVEIDLAVPDGV